MTNIVQTDLFTNLSGYSLAVEDSYGLETLTLSVSTPNFLDNPTQLLDSISSETETITGDRDTREIVIIDDVEIDRQALIDEISGASDVLVLSDEVDSIAQISQSLGQYEEIDAVHIISHGDASQLFSGNTEVNNQDLAKYEELLEVGNDLLAEDTNLIFYEANLASYGELTYGEFSDLLTNNADLLGNKSELYIDHGIKKDLSRLGDTNFRAVDSTFEAEDLFDADYYLANNPEVQDSGDDPYTHYVQSGWLDDLDPHPLFDTSYYLEQDPNLDASVEFNPLQHFAQVGVDEGFNPHPVFAQPDQVFIARSSGEGIDLGTIWAGFVVGGSLFLDAAKNIWEFFSEESTPILFTPADGSIPIGTPPFELPPENDAGIYVEIFPGGISFKDILSDSLFPNPDDSELEFSGVVTTPRESDVLDDLVNAPFVFPGSEEVIQGTYVLDIEGDSSSLDGIDVTVVGQPDFPEELTQGIRLGQLEGGGTITFLGNNSQGIEGYFTPSGETVEKPFSLKNASTVGRKANLIQRINDNGIQIQRAGITDPVLLRINVPQFEAEELKNFVENGPIKNIPSEGIFEKIYFDAADGTVVVDSTGTTIIR